MSQQIQHRTMSVFDRWPRRATNVPHALETWALEQGLIRNPWLELIVPDSVVDGDIFALFEDNLRFVIEEDGRRYYAGDGSDFSQKLSDCYWLGLSV